jgi:hypothetical protein
MKFSMNWVKILVVFALIGSCIAISPVAAAIFDKEGKDLTESQLYELTNATSPTEENKTVIYFYDPDCGSCAKVEEFMTPFLEKNPEAKVKKISVATNETMQQFTEKKTEYNREKIFVPVMFFGPVALEGSNDITNNFGSVYSWYTKE